MPLPNLNERMSSVLSGPLGLDRPAPTAMAEEPEAPQFEPGMSDQEILALWQEKIRPSHFDNRHIFERQWTRNLFYILGRQWIEYYGRSGGWKDKRLAAWIPKPVTNMCKTTVIAIRAMFTAIKLGVNVRPNGNSAKNVSAAATADELAPTLHERHRMNTRLGEFDFWLGALGNAFIHTFVDYNPANGFIRNAVESCVTCGEEFTSDQLVGATQCPGCGASARFLQATNPDGTPKVNYVVIGRPTTIALSPLEIALPSDYTTFDEVPEITRLRWRTKRYYESHPDLKHLVPQIAWQKAPQDQTLQIFRSLANSNDLGLAPSYLNEGAGTISAEDGIPEYECWVKPTETYPQGLVFRIVGDSKPLVLRLPNESIPGPLPYTDAEGKPLFTFAHAGFEHMGGRLWASSPVDAIIQKQDQLNQLDSMTLLIIQRMANPVWLEPKGAEIERLTGMPGLVIKWNPLTVGGNAKPERIAGEGPPQALFTIREQLVRDIEELAGTFDIVKGSKPTGVEAFSALQLLDERSKSRFAYTFQQRGDAYKQWFSFAIELERAFGPDKLTVQSLTPAKTWTFKDFQRTQLQGSVSVVIEDGSAAPKTSLGQRAALEHANNLQMLDMTDPDQRYEGLKLFGLAKLAPSIDIHVQSALRKQQAFEDWLNDPQAIQQQGMAVQAEFAKYQQQTAPMVANPNVDPMTGMAAPLPPPPSPLKGSPLEWFGWYDARIHRQELLKWANSDQIVALMKQKPEVAQLITLHQQEIEVAIPLQMAIAAGAPPPPVAQGAGMAMQNSNRESTQGVEPSGVGTGAQNQGPA